MAEKNTTLSTSIHSASIAEIQGAGFESPYVNKGVRTQGVVIGLSRKGFFIQDPAGKPDDATSCGIFVYTHKHTVKQWQYVEIEGLVLDFTLSEAGRPVTEIRAVSVTVLEETAPEIEPVWLSNVTLPSTNSAVAQFLNAHEGMLLGLEEGATFIAPSNPFADYVVLPCDYLTGLVRSVGGGVLLESGNPDRWFPGFRLLSYDHAVKVNVGDILESPVVGPLHYRAESYQLAVSGPIEVKSRSSKNESSTVSELEQDDTSISVMTLNGLNLDEKLEDKTRVQDPRRDIDDDLGNGRFIRLARAVVRQAKCPDVVALQEIQDNDGAELGDTVSASETYSELISAIKSLGGVQYDWADIPPQAGMDGGQPGGNIRNGFLFNAQRVGLVTGSLKLIGNDAVEFEGSRKPLMGRFFLKNLPKCTLTIVNVHLASKRHQNGIFALKQPGYDSRESVRVAQAETVRQALLPLYDSSQDYYVTGDFNDNEYSDTLKALMGSESCNLVSTLLENDRYDYNHRGKLQVLMHGIVSMKQYQQKRAQYQILHGNELQGIKPGELGNKASDHAYVIARLSLI